MAKLILLTLPIGNMMDLSQRVRESLEGEHTFFVEDTRVFKDRVARAGIELRSKALYSFHDQDRSKTKLAIELLESGVDVYLASDAGSPMISDPAFPLVSEVIDKGFEIDSFPGPNSVVTALELSGLPPHPFHFYGFLPKETEKKKKIFESCGASSGTHIFFESPHRIISTTDTAFSILGEVEVVLAKELTKTFQSIHRFSRDSWESRKDEVVEKGEFVFLFHIKESKKISSSKITKLAEESLEKPNNKKLSKLLSEILGRKSKEIYAELEQNSKNTD
ncbi:MAG: 16S rRNA (cytidine1402-2'-O)-methyltransferase [Bacteriovoracaceae bacterium]|jgi:16S rRNA (cytidine1402-2'-O)-methyltransferase